MTLIVNKVANGPSREELVGAFTDWWSENRPAPVFTMEDGSEWRLEVIGLQMIDGTGRVLLVSGSMIGVKKDLPVSWDEEVVLEIKYDTRKRTGFMKQVR